MLKREVTITVENTYCVYACIVKPRIKFGCSGRSVDDYEDSIIVFLTEEECEQIKRINPKAVKEYTDLDFLKRFKIPPAADLNGKAYVMTLTNPCKDTVVLDSSGNRVTTDPVGKFAVSSVTFTEVDWESQSQKGTSLRLKSVTIM
jgi:hypothetical protein